jgi:hypothetical protein
MKPGLYTNIPEEQYHSDEAISSHGLNALARSPLHYWSYYKNPERPTPKETPALKIGSAIHKAILEPDKFEKEYVQEPQLTDYKGVLDKLEDYKERAKALGLPVSGTKGALKYKIQSQESLQDAPGSVFWDDIVGNIVQGRISLSKAEYKACRGISYRVHKHPAASKIFSSGIPEASIFWTDPDTGVSCRGRIDWIQLEPDTAEEIIYYTVADIKSTQNASPASFQRDVFKYGYHIQAAMYWDGMSALGYYPQSFVFSAWEKKPPFATALYYMTEELLEAGRKEYKRLLKIYAECLKTDNWPGYSNSIEPLLLPDWYGKTEIIEEVESEDWLAEL